jgi:hypothetical protein
MITNKNAGYQVTIDLDVFFDDFLKNPVDIPSDVWPIHERPNITVYHIRDDLKVIQERFQQDIKTEYRRSSSGNVHVRLTFQKEITILEGFLVRAWLADDLKRMRLDMKRYFSSESLLDMNRTFDQKCVGGVSHAAGPWIPLNVNITDLPQDAPAFVDYRAFSIIKNRNEGQARLAV